MTTRDKGRRRGMKTTATRAEDDGDEGWQGQKGDNEPDGSGGERCRRRDGDEGSTKVRDNYLKNHIKLKLVDMGHRASEDEACAT